MMTTDPVQIPGATSSQLQIACDIGIDQNSACTSIDQEVAFNLVDKRVLRGIGPSARHKRTHSAQVLWIARRRYMERHAES